VEKDRVAREIARVTGGFSSLCCTWDDGKGMGRHSGAQYFRARSPLGVLSRYADALNPELHE
jgi:hypothetical protein